MMDSNTCLDLALEGERLCKAGDCRGGVAFFEAAVQAGTDDLRTLSAIYSQLGNAYFYLGDYGKAMQYHKHDLTLARNMSDRLGEAKASGNLGNTLKVMGKFDEAVVFCKRHLDISRELADKVGEGRALYNLGNVYHAKGKHIGRLGHQDPGEFPEDVKNCLQKAVEYYEENLKLMKELGDRAAQGRACGNLGNTHYLLGNFTQAIQHHNERLKIAREFGDKPAERRAHSNLGNAHIFLGEFETAADHYKKTLQLAQELSDQAVEAQACYSLGNTYTLLQDYPTAIDYHLRHLRIAQDLKDKVGEGRACWSLGNAHSAMSNHEKALYFANRHLEISKDIGDRTGQATAQMNLSDLRKVLGLPAQPSTEELSGGDVSPTSERHSRVRRFSMEEMDLLKLTPDPKAASNVKKDPTKESTENLPLEKSIAATAHPDRNTRHINEEENQMDEDSFFDLLSRFQSKRMNDQRCSLNILENKENQRSLGNRAGSLSSNAESSSTGNSTPNDSSDQGTKMKEELLDLIAGMQSKRMDEQRASLPSLPGLSAHNSTSPQILQRLSVASENNTVPDDSFFDMLMRCQGSRIEDQRSTLPSESDEQIPKSAPTVPDEDFFSLILRLQSGRLDDQRAEVPVPEKSRLTKKGTKKEEKKK